MNQSPLPAHQTKAVAQLSYNLWEDQVISLNQIDSVADSTGRTVWLGAQVLSIYLHELFKSEKPLRRDGKRKRVIDLGAGTGLLSIGLYTDGYDVLSTDIPIIASTILEANIARNLSSTSPAQISSGSLDWFVDPTLFDFASRAITCAPGDVSLESGWDREPQLAHERLQPPFDFIVSTDSVYHPGLITPLLRTLQALSLPPYALPRKPPLIYICLERRDALLVESFLDSAREAWGFKCRMVDKSRLAKLVGEGWGWQDDDWDGIEIWKFIWSGDQS